VIRLKRSKILKFWAVLFALALFAAACGSDDEAATTTADEPAAEESSVLGSEEPAPEPEPAAEEPAAEEPAMEEEPAAEEPAAEEPAAEEPAMSEGTVTDAVNGDGAELWEAAVDAGAVAADSSLEPFVITMSNLEGSPAGSFPEIREGAEAAERTINEELGGINGRPVKLEVCVHGLDPAEATNCANEIADKNPNFHIQGIDFFNPLMWPTFVGAGIPVLETVPIFVSDFNTPGLLSTEGGCVAAFPGMVQYGVDVLKTDRFAIVHSDTGPGLECYADTQERFLVQLQNEKPGTFEFAPFPDASGDPTDNDAIVQNIIEFFQGAENPVIGFGIQASDCNEILSALSSAGVEATIVASGSCRDDSVLANPASAGVHFGGGDTITDRPDLWTEYQQKYFDFRDASLNARPNKEAPESAFMEVGHDVMMTVWVQMSRMQNDGGDINDAPAVIAFLSGQSNLFRPGFARPLDCTTNGVEFVSVCNKFSNNYIWSGPGGQFDYGPAGTEGVDVTDLLARTAEGNPRPAAG
jgi:ABC-type branched-subunit amino acid transport system substrate-binding protein